MRNIRLNVVTRLARYASIPVVAVSLFIFFLNQIFIRGGKRKKNSVIDGAAEVRQCWQTCQVHGVISGSRGDSRSVGWEAPCCPLKYSCVTWTQRRPNARLNGRTTQFRTQQSHGIPPPHSSSRQQTFLMTCIIHFAIYKCIRVFRLGKRINSSAYTPFEIKMHEIMQKDVLINNPVIFNAIGSGIYLVIHL